MDLKEGLVSSEWRPGRVAEHDLAQRRSAARWPLSDGTFTGHQGDRWQPSGV